MLFSDIHIIYAYPLTKKGKRRLLDFCRNWKKHNLLLVWESIFPFRHLSIPCSKYLRDAIEQDLSSMEDGVYPEDKYIDRVHVYHCLGQFCFSDIIEVRMDNLMQSIAYKRAKVTIAKLWKKGIRDPERYYKEYLNRNVSICHIVHMMRKVFGFSIIETAGVAKQVVGYENITFYFGKEELNAR